MLHCGICNGDERAYKYRNQIPHQDTLLGHRALGLTADTKHVMNEIPHGANVIEIEGEKYVHWYTDGSTINGKSPILARSGWAVYAAEDSKFNTSRMLYGPSQSTYRAELRAVLHVARYTDINVFVKSDCKSVVNTTNDILRGEPKTLESIANSDISEADLWQQLVLEITKSTHRKIRCEWMPAHLDDDQGEGKHADQANPKIVQKREEDIAKINNS